MTIHSSSLVHDASTDIRDLQNLLRDGYKGGFPILKELLQNADDAGATRLVISAHEGLAECVNPLLRAPGLFVANDGPVRREHMDGMARASGGSKAGERSSVGKFGLGQKSVYNLCDAFLALGWLEDESDPFLLRMNPWKDFRAADSARSTWESDGEEDDKAAIAMALSLGFDRGLALFLPLRTAKLRPGPGLSIIEENWTPAQAVRSMLQAPELEATICCARNLKSVEIRSSEEHRVYSHQAEALRLHGPEGQPGEFDIVGRLASATGETIFIGRQRRSFVGETMSLLSEGGWDKVYDERHQLQPPKGEPHGAVIICRRPSTTSSGSLTLREAVYLPLQGELARLPLRDVPMSIDVLLHGYYFVKSDRTGRRKDEHIESRWNDSLFREITAPLFLDALGDCLNALASPREAYVVLRAIGDSTWWAQHLTEVAAGRALALFRIGKKETWGTRSVNDLRPVPRMDACSARRLAEVWPQMDDWCTRRGISLALGSYLSDELLRWRDEELAELITLAGPQVFSNSSIAETVTALLEAAGKSVGPQTQSALAGCFRRAAAEIGGSRFATADRIRALIAFLPDTWVVRLPPSVERRDLIAALADADPALPIKAEWMEDGAGTEPSINCICSWLAVLEPFLEKGGDGAKQASALVARLIGNGGVLGLIASDDRTRELRVVPVTRMPDREGLRISLEELSKARAEGRVFDRAPNRELTLLTQAITSPAVFQIGLPESGLSLASAKQDEALLHIVEQAEEFGDPEARGELADKLASVGSNSALRSLLTGMNQLPSSVDVLELDRIDPQLEELAHTLMREREVVLVPSAAARKLRDATRQKLQLGRLDKDTLGRWLLEAAEVGALPALGDHEAMALLTSGISDQVLSQLPLHKAQGHHQLRKAAELFIAKDNAVPLPMAKVAELADLWPDNNVAAVQRRLIQRWGPEATIATALQQSRPEQFTDQIADALGQTAQLSDKLLEQLRDTAWIAAEGKAYRLSDVLDIPPDTAAALQRLSRAEKAFLLPTALPASLRSAEVRIALERYNLLPDRASAIELAFMLAGDCGAIQSIAPISAIAEEIVRLRPGGNDLALALIKAALEEGVDPTVVWQWNSELAPPDLGEITRQLNQMVEWISLGSVGEAARAVHRASFLAKLADLIGHDGFLPRDLQVPSESGHFKEAAALAIAARGVAPADMLARSYSWSDDDEQSYEQGLAAQSNRPIAEVIGQALEPLREFDVNNAVLLLLAMVGRDAKIQAIADDWRGQRSFENICIDLDGLTSSLGLPRDEISRTIEGISFTADLSDDDTLQVRSAAGSLCRVPRDGASVLISECRQEGSIQEGDRRKRVWHAELALPTPADESEARRILEAAIDQLARPAMLRLESQHAALRDLLASYFGAEQFALRDTQDALRDELQVHLRTLKPGKVLRKALVEWDKTYRINKDEANRTLWDVARNGEGEAELLAAIRNKVEEMGYRPHRTLFELYQNSVDAQAQWQGDGEIRVEAIRQNDGSIIKVRFLHWGRPINQPGRDRSLADEEGHGRDLNHMLALHQSGKHGENVTGRFGLGFKTTHMLCDEVRIASAAIATRIKGGMIPDDWPEGLAAVKPFDRRGRRATLIELPIAAGRIKLADEAWSAFSDAAPHLACLAKHGMSLTLSDNGDETLLVPQATELACGVELVSVGTRKALRFTLGHRYRMIIPLGRVGPFAFAEGIPQFWHLVPMIGEERRGGWLIDGPFQVDPGRTQFSGAPEERAGLFGALGLDLGQRLCDLHYYLEANWSEFARETGLDPAGRADFWQSLIKLLAMDLESDRAQQELHGRVPARGLGRLLSEKPVVPLALGGFASAGTIRWRLEGALSTEEGLSLVACWPELASVGAELIGERTARLLARLDLPRGKPLGVADLVSEVVGKTTLDGALAARFAPLLELKDEMLGSEENAFRELLRELRWLAEDESAQSIRDLSFPQSEDPREKLRATMAPSSGRLHPSFTSAGFELAFFARGQTGYTDTGLAERWLKAATSFDQQVTCLRYIAGSDSATIARLINAGNWIPELDDLRGWPPFEALSPDEQSIIRFHLGGWSERPFEPRPQAQWQNAADAAEVLEGVREWWVKNRGELTSRYERSTYPEVFSVEALKAGDDSAWFTMLSLATFQTLGRVRPGQSRSFLQSVLGQARIEQLAAIGPEDRELAPFVDLLLDWSEPDAREDFLLWRRCLVDLCLVARNLEDYRMVFRKLPHAIHAAKGQFSFRNYLVPAQSALAARMGVDAPSLVRSLGMGANWVVRECLRRGVYASEHQIVVGPYGWCAPARVRRLMKLIGVGCYEATVDGGRGLHAEVARLMVTPSPFGSDGDLPLHLITLAEHSGELGQIICDAGGDTTFLQAGNFEDDD